MKVKNPQIIISWLIIKPKLVWTSVGIHLMQVTLLLYLTWFTNVFRFWNKKILKCKWAGNFLVWWYQPRSERPGKTILIKAVKLEKRVFSMKFCTTSSTKNSCGKTTNIFLLVFEKFFWFLRKILKGNFTRS